VTAWCSLAVESPGDNLSNRLLRQIVFAGKDLVCGYVQEDRLYRKYYDSFEEFIKAELGHQRDYGYKLIKAHDVLTGLLEEGVSAANLPDTERLCRELARVPDKKERKLVWERSNMLAEKQGKPMDATLIQDVIDEQGEGNPDDKDGEGESEDKTKTNQKRNKRQIKEALEKFRTLNKELMAHLDFEDWDDAEKDTLFRLLGSIALAAGTVRDRLKKHHDQLTLKV
jgi:hypothetical protein